MRALAQLGWPPPLADKAAAASGGQTPGAAGQGPFVNAADAALDEVQRLLLAMVTLQHSADTESFAAVRLLAPHSSGNMQLALVCHPWPVTSLYHVIHAARAAARHVPLNQAPETTAVCAPPINVIEEGLADLPSNFDKVHRLLQAEESGAEGPLLWAVQELASPLEARLRHHFASGLPTDRLDRPEWLYTTALRVAREAGPQLAPLQPALSVPTPGLLYDVQASGVVHGLGCAPACKRAEHPENCRANVTSPS